MGAVVAIGCDVPPDVSVEQGPDGWVVTPQKVPSPLQECFAPVTRSRSWRCRPELSAVTGLDRRPGGRSASTTGLSGV